MSTADDPAARVVKTRPVEVALGSSKSFDTAKAWLGKCYADHEDCSQLGTNAMPTRCLKVDNLDAIHLCMTQYQGHSYAALSYCWGPEQFPNLIATKESVKGMLMNIPLTSFPLTLRDGIIVAHELGLRYLWIDALCIIQDDDEDKNNEIPQMRRIFSNAYCTIIAATAAHCHAGFLHTRELPSSPDLCIPYPGPDVDNGHIFLRKSNPGEWTLYDPLEDPVNDRAWTLEERLLSPRRLIYSKNHLRWLCETIELTNGGDTEDRKWPSSTRRDQMERLPPHLSPRISTSTINGDATLQSYDTWYSWLSIVREYNLRSLTKSKDKLRAIGGIAELYHLKTGDQYCAGLWRSHLAEELLWKVFHPRADFSSMIAESRDPTTISRPSITLLPRPKYRAPTWSWASVDGTVANHRALSHSPFVADVFEVIDCVVVPEKSHTPLTTVKAAVLTVRGRMKTAFLHIKSHLLYKTEEALHQVVKEESWKVISELGPFAPLTSSIPGCHEMDVDFGTCDLDALEHEQYPEYRSVHCLEITSRVREGFIGNQQGLVLVNAAAEGTFNRIGIFGTDALGENWFADAVPQIVRIT